MNFQDSLMNGKAKKVMPNWIRASSLFKSSLQAIETAKLILITPTSLKSI